MKEYRDSAGWTGRPYPLPQEPTIHSQGHGGFGPPVYGAEPASAGLYADRRFPPAAVAPRHNPQAAAGHFPAYPPQPPGYPAYAKAFTPQAGGGNAAAPPTENALGARAMPVRDVLHGLGAVLSLVLIVGAGAWVWQMMQRDVSGVPVVRALEGPLRVTPENPGGLQAAHQGLAINELAGAQDSAELRDIVLAPGATDLLAEDSAPIRAPAPAAPAAPAQIDPQEVTQPIMAALQRDVDAPAAPREPLGFNSATPRAVAISPRPPTRTETRVAMASPTSIASEASASTAADMLAASVASSVARGLSTSGARDVDPATIGPGTRLVQLGAFDDIATARTAWDQLARQFSPLLDERGRVIEAAHSGGSVFYRLRAHGFEDERDARRFCAALVNQQVDCIPVLIR